MRAGFSLIEMSIVLLIISIVAAGGLTVGQAVTKRTEYQTTDEQMAELKQALLFYYQSNSRLPCPARRDLKLGDAQFGREILWDGAGTSCANDTTTPAGTSRIETSSGSGIWMRVGGLPTRDMALPDTMMKDQFGQRFSYAVIEGLTDDTTFSAATGAITVNDGTGTDIATNIAFAIISHGDDGKGAYSYKSGALTACGSSTRDAENCDADTILTDSRYNDGEVAANFYDDRVIWMDKDSVVNQAAGLGTGGGGGSGGTSIELIAESADETGYTAAVHAAVADAVDEGKEVSLICGRGGTKYKRHITAYGVTASQYIPTSGTSTSTCNTSTELCYSSGTSACNDGGWKIYASGEAAAAGGGSSSESGIRWAGVTTATYDGNLGGITSADAKCATEFSGSRILRSTDLQYFTSASWTSMMSDIAVTTIYSDSSAPIAFDVNNFSNSFTSWIEYSSNNCNNLTSTTAGSKLVVIGSNSDMFQRATITCSSYRPLACVYE